MRGRYDFLVVGAGFAGSVVAERLATAGKRVLVIDKHSHVGGSAYDEYDEHGLLVHRYGPHIFHTNSRRILGYLSAFTHWRFYEHRGLGVVDGNTYEIPINRNTLNQLYGLDLNENECVAWLNRMHEHRNPVKSSEDFVLNSVGRDLYEKFFLNYMLKQWELHPSELSSSVAAMFPVRTNTDNRYFDDVYQMMPVPGYTQMFQKMLAHPNITVELNFEFASGATDVNAQHVVYTGPIDSYFDHCEGKLPYRSVIFEHQHLPHVEWYQPVGQVSFPNDHAFTRITEFKHLTGQEHRGTSILREYPTAEGEPYYPVPTESNEALYGRYADRARSLRTVTFVGRLAQYRYYHMDQVVGAALKAADNLLGKGS